GALLDIALDFGVLRLYGLEIIQLVEAQKAQLPQIVAEHVAFIEQQFAADHFVARAGVAGEIDAPHEELFLLIEGEGQINGVGGGVYFRIGNSRKVDEAEISVQLGVVLDGLADFGHAENVAFFERKNGFEVRGLEKEALIGIGVAHMQRAHVVALAFFDGNGDVRLPALMDSNQGYAFRQHSLIDGGVLNDRIFHQYLEISVVLVESADSDFHVFVKFGAVEGLGQHGNKIGRHRAERNPVGLGIAHGADDFAAGKRGVARKKYFADLHFGAFIDVEGELYGVRAGEPFEGRFDAGVLAAVLGQQLFLDDFPLFDFRGIELALNRESNLAVLEAVQDVGFGNRFVALVFDAADNGAL